MTLRRSEVGVVVIGRNEGDRLRRCFASLRSSEAQVVYIDSGSSDGSVPLAEEAGVTVVELDPMIPFSAARARNEGIAALREAGLPRYIQFIDGDCELQAGWLANAVPFLDQNPLVAVASGRRRERFPEKSVYNRLCDREWNTPLGIAKACGGDALIRADALGNSGGFNPALIAGEEPELCARLRQAGWEVWRLDQEMTLHDANITSFFQWSTRARRGGHAAAEGMALHGAAPEYLGVRTVRGAVLWALILPCVVILSIVIWRTLGLVVALVYPAQVARLAYREGWTRSAWEYALFMTIAKFPELQGMLEYWIRKKFRSPAKVIEYK